MPADSPIPQRSAPPAPSAAAESPFFVVLNRGAGAGDKDAARDAVEGVLREAGRTYQIREPRGESIDALLRRVAREAAQAGGVLVAGGGDGTINTAVNAARRHGVPLGLLPMGTYNYLAREHGIPLEPEAAARALLDATAKDVLMGEVNGRLFFNNASIGLLTDVVRRRERAKRRFGRHRIVAAIANVSAFLEGRPPFAVQTIVDDAAAMKYTSMVYVGCNRLMLEDLGLSTAACHDAGQLAVLVMRPTHFLQRLRILLRTALRQLEADGRLETFCAAELEVRSGRRHVNVAIDGETVPMRVPLRFRAVPRALRLLVPVKRDRP